MFRKDEEENSGNYKLVSFTLILGKMLEQIFLESVSRFMEDKKVIGSGQHGFTKCKPCLTNLIAFHNEVNN